MITCSQAPRQDQSFQCKGVTGRERHHCSRASTTKYADFLTERKVGGEEGEKCARRGPCHKEKHLGKVRVMQEIELRAASRRFDRLDNDGSR